MVPISVADQNHNFGQSLGMRFSLPSGFSNPPGEASSHVAMFALRNKAAQTMNVVETILAFEKEQITAATTALISEPVTSTRKKSNAVLVKARMCVAQFAYQAAEQGV